MCRAHQSAPSRQHLRRWNIVFPFASCVFLDLLVARYARAGPHCRMAALHALGAAALRARAARAVPRALRLHRAVQLCVPRPLPPRWRALRHASGCVRQALTAMQLSYEEQAPHQGGRQSVYPHERVRDALVSDAAGRAGDLAAALLDDARCLAALLGRHPSLLRHQVASSPGAPSAEASADHDASHAAEAAAAQARLLRLLDALEAHCPAVLRGRADVGASAGRGGDGAAAAGASARNLLPPARKAALGHCFRRLDGLAAFATLVPDSAWAQPPEAWRPSAAKRRVVPLLRAVCRSRLSRLRRLTPSPVRRIARRAAAACSRSCAACFATWSVRATTSLRRCTTCSRDGVCRTSTRLRSPACGAAWPPCSWRLRAAAASGASLRCC
jgi:hypothetical protein